jgi:hypothetical protein
MMAFWDSKFKSGLRSNWQLPPFLQTNLRPVVTVRLKEMEAKIGNIGKGGGRKEERN